MNKPIQTPLLIIASILCFVAVANLPIGYFTFLRVMLSITALMVIMDDSKTGLTAWTIAFGIILVLFNPVIPVYLHNKSIWIPIDVISGVICLAKAFKKSKHN